MKLDLRGYLRLIQFLAMKSNRNYSQFSRCRSRGNVSSCFNLVFKCHNASCETNKLLAAKKGRSEVGTLKIRDQF